MTTRTSGEPMLAPPVQELQLLPEGYARLPEVERELHELVHLPTRVAQERRLKIPAPMFATAPAVPDSTHAESVAYFVRECHRPGQHPATQRETEDWLAAQVFERSNGFILWHLRGVVETDREDARTEVLMTMFREMYALEKPGGEYYQVRFWNAVKMRCFSTYRTHKKRQDENETLRARFRRGEDGEMVNPLDRVPDDAPLPDALPWEEDAVTRGLRYLRQHWNDPDRERKCDVFALRYLEGYPVGEKDKPGTLAGLYHVTPKSINNWINAVKDALAAYLQQEGEGV